MNCNICNKPIILIPSAKERAKKHGGKPSYYTTLFTTHSECYLEKYRKDTSELIRRNNQLKRKTEHENS